MTPKVSALMSTYANEKAEHLSAALESVYGQTVPPDEMVLVVDGPIGADQESVISVFQADPRIPVCKVVRSPRSIGLANALNLGLAECRGTYVMRMDSDDLSIRTRLQRQLHRLSTQPDIDLVASWCMEFVRIDGPMQMKEAPSDHDGIVEALRWRNVICHPAVLVRRESLEAVGGYRDTYGKLEDYDLYVRMILAGFRMSIVPFPLLLVRVSMDQRKRRGGLDYFRRELRFRRFCYESGFLTQRQYATSMAFYAVFRLVPSWIRHQMYRMSRSTVSIPYDQLDAPALS